ncbi:MAG: hypothetical protein M3R51_03240 [Candidatus Eremiobacteraeota bacterium]|nr:hypothetical protein [Candidatus Eremiobacteraeota bacterium]
MRYFALSLLAVAIASASTAASQLQWRGIGPAGAGGRVSGVAGSNRDPLLYYFGSAGGGVFKTTNGGLTWHDVWPQSSVGAIGDVTIAPSNDDIVWAGTGEPNPRNDASYGDGMWMSRDAGVHWLHRGLNGTFAISRIIVDSRDPGSVVVAALGNPYVDSASRGVYRTTNGGLTWRRTLYIGPQSGASDIADSVARPNVVFAGMWQFRRRPWTFASGGARDGIYRSTDGGRTWKHLAGNGLPSGTIGRIGLAVAPSDPSRVYALIQSKRGLLFRSDDAGNHWRTMSSDTLLDQRPFYMSRLQVDPSNRDRVFFASENLIETRDGGVTFHDISSAVHQDHHGMWISQSGKRIIEADDGGAPISVDGGKTWDWRFNVTLAQVYHVALDDRQPFHACAAMQDNDSFCAPNLSLSPIGLLNSDWRDVANDSDGVWAVPEPGAPDAIWNVGINELNGQLGIYDYASRQNYDISPDVTDTNGRALAGLPHRFNWEAPIAFSPKEAGTAYFGGNVVFKTTDRGRTWNAISPDLTRNDPQKQQLAGGPVNTDISGAEFYDTLLDIAASPLDAATIWAGTDDGLIQRTSDGGAHWNNVTPPSIGPWGRIEAVEPSHYSVARAYAVVDRHLMGDNRPYVIATADGGTTWSPIVNGLPVDQPARVVREDPYNADVLYAGLEQGVWYSIDRGAHWRNFRLNMPSVSVHDLRIAARDRTLVAGTHGRGIYVFDDLTSIENLAMAEAANRPLLFAPLPAISWYYWWKSQYAVEDTGCCAPAGMFAAPDPAYGALVSYYLPRPERATPYLEVSDGAGALVRRIDGSNTAGINRVTWDLASEPPVPWRGTGDWNQGPDDGPAVVPGRYTLRLHAGDAINERRIDVRADPRSSWTQEDYVSRYAFLRSIDEELGSIDAALNEVDSLRAGARGAVLADAQRVRSMFTSGVRNSEDDQLMPDQLRERLMILAGTVALSQGPPLPPHYREALAIRGEYKRAMDRYNAFLKDYHIAVTP